MIKTVGVLARDANRKSGKMNAMSLGELLNFCLEFTVLLNLKCRIFVEDARKAHLRSKPEACCAKGAYGGQKYRRESTVCSHWGRSSTITLSYPLPTFFLSYKFFIKVMVLLPLRQIVAYKGLSRHERICSCQHISNKVLCGNYCSRMPFRCSSFTYLSLEADTNSLVINPEPNIN